LCRGQCCACRGPPDSGRADSERERSRAQLARVGGRRAGEGAAGAGEERRRAPGDGRRRRSPFPCNCCCFDPALLEFGSTGRAGAGSGEEQRGPPLLGTARWPRGDDGAASSPGRPPSLLLGFRFAGSRIWVRERRRRYISLRLRTRWGKSKGWGIEDEETASFLSPLSWKLEPHQLPSPNLQLSWKLE
jgi:hypothetical protein